MQPSFESLGIELSGRCYFERNYYIKLIILHFYQKPEAFFRTILP
jgi:hypothetical protein